MFKCVRCGNLFEEGEEKLCYETHGLDCPPYETYWGCPVCEGEFIETEKCSCCGSEKPIGELTSGVCDDCIESAKHDYKYRPDLCYKLTENESATVGGINPFLAGMFTSEEINKILYKELLICSCSVPVDCSPFIESDVDSFVDKVFKG